MTDQQGFSWKTFDSIVGQILSILKPGRVLDIGAGQGKYGSLIRQLGLTDIQITAVECDAELNGQLIANGYQNILNITAQDLYKYSNDTFEVVILGDVIEHLRHSEGQDLLEFLIYRCAYIIVVTPECMPMNHPVFFVGHNSHWPPRAMNWHDWWAHDRVGQMHLYILRGLLDWHAVPLLELVNQINASQAPLEVPYSADKTRIRPVDLKVVDNRMGNIHPDNDRQYMTYRPT